MEEEIWTLSLQLEGATPGQRIVEKEMDKDYICFMNLVGLIEEIGFSSIDYIYYKKRDGFTTATLVEIVDDNVVARMIVEHEGEKKVRLCVVREKLCNDTRVSISPSKLLREFPTSQPNEVQQTRTMVFRDDIIESYKNSGKRDEAITWLWNQRREQDEMVSNSSESPTNWPSHARLCRTQIEATDPKRKSGRGTLKGYKAGKKRIESGHQKLHIQFSSRLGGAVGINYRSFVDEVVMFTKKKAPIIGVKKWKEIDQAVKDSIAKDVLKKWDLEDSMITKKMIWDIARERYRGWRSNLHSTYKAYNTDGERLRNKPEDLDLMEWEYLIHYFGTDKKFQDISQKNSENHKKQKTKHVTGSKSFSQTSYEKRNTETGEEPNDLELWQVTHMKNGEWSNTLSKDVYETAHTKVSEKETQSGNPVVNEEQNIIFQTSYRASTGCKTSQARGHGYMSNSLTTAERLHAQMDQQARVSAETQQQNVELRSEVEDLREKLSTQQAESDRLLEAERNARLKSQEEERNARLQIQEEDRKGREQLREELIRMFGGQIATLTQQSAPASQIQSENPDLHATTKNNQGSKNARAVRSLFQDSTSGGAASNTHRVISSHQLAQAAKNYGRSRTDKDRII